MTPKEIIYQAIGEASMCWENTPTGIFDSDRAKEIGDRIWNQYTSLESRIQKLEAVAEAAKAILTSDEPTNATIRLGEVLEELERE